MVLELFPLIGIGYSTCVDASYVHLCSLAAAAKLDYCWTKKGSDSPSIVCSGVSPRYDCARGTEIDVYARDRRTSVFRLNVSMADIHEMKVPSIHPPTSSVEFRRRTNKFNHKRSCDSSKIIV